MPSSHALRAAAVILSAAVLLPATAHAGPPWISIELPANPHDPSTRGAFLLVHGFHHDIALPTALTGQAISFVNGQRRTLALSFARTGRAGVSALHASWPTEGTWVLAITLREKDAHATALVGIRNGQVSAVRVPSRTDGRWTIPRAVSDRDIDAFFREVQGDIVATAGTSTHPAAVLVFALGLLVPVIAVRRRRAR